MRVLPLLLVLLAGPAAAADWPDTPLARLSAQAQVQGLNAELLSRDSATATLQRWCDAHGPGGGARIVARRITGADKTPGEAERRDLKVTAEAPVAYRRVELACGDKVLSEADNWYLPARLTPAMNTALNTTQTPFGVVVRPLDFRRRTLAAEALFQPLPAGWEGRPLPAAGPGTLAVPHEILRHRAVLATPDGTPFSLVVETYTDATLIEPRS
ncbi:hypothetical protein [Phenylobacterium sp.]|uniref:hypothetical protein n=1 Tax=Phenylobacterium sp. TaxID=1871053 RepID=UPI0027292CE3|nr:hypothetical protein [Phenylobacterium sp.]MDO8379576.1 hypothetical protein [Phenylobacterium sp.]